MSNGKVSEEEKVLALSDITQALKRGKKTIFRVVSFCAVCGVLFALSRPVLYLGEATFRQRENQEAGVGGSLFEIFSRGTSRASSHAQSMMKSRTVLQRAAIKCDLQATVSRKGVSFPRIKTFANNVLTAYAYFRNRSESPFTDYPLPLQCKEVYYDGEKAKGFEIVFSSEEEYTAYTADKKSLGTGSLGQPFKGGDFQFTLERCPRNESLSRKHFIVSLAPLRSVVKALSGTIKIDEDEDDKNLLNVSLKHPDRHLAARVVNTVMDEYKKYLEEENTLATRTQLEYLKRRKEEMKGLVQQLMEDHAKACSQDICNTGFIDSAKQLEFLTRSESESRARLMAIDLELKRLHHLQEGGQCVYYDTYAPTGDAQIINSLLLSMRDLSQQRDALNLAIEETQFKITPADLQEFAGIDLSMANQLYLTYTRQHDDIEASIKQNDFLGAEVLQEGFDISSLSGVLNDPVSGEIIGAASHLLLKLRDENNITVKEQERLKEGVSQQRAFLSNHLKQTRELASLRRGLIESKIAALHQTMLELIKEQIALKGKHLSDYVSARIENLGQEEQLLNSHLDSLHTKMAELPKKWVGEQLIKELLDLQQRLSREIAELVESKNLKSNLELVQSAPVDRALLPYLPQKPKIMLFMAVGVFLGAFCSSAFVLFKSFHGGVRAASTNLSTEWRHYSGYLSLRSDQTSLTLSDDDLSTLRRLIAAVCDPSKKGLCLLVEGRGPHFAPHMAKLLSRRGNKVLLLPLSFERVSEESTGGLLEVLEGKALEPLVLNKGIYDEVLPGGVSRWGSELSASGTFLKLVNRYKESYDWILAYTQATATSAEVEALLALADSIAVTVDGETLDTLGIYKGRTVSFVTTKGTLVA